MNSPSRRNSLKPILLRSLNCRTVLNSSSPMSCSNVIRSLSCSLTARRSRHPLLTRLALLFWCSLRRPLERGHSLRRPFKNKGLRRHKNKKEIWTAPEAVFLRTPSSTERARCGGSATTLSLCFTRRSLIPSLSLSTARYLRISNKRWEIKWVTMP